MNKGDAAYEERFKEQIERAREILERDVAAKTWEQVNKRIAWLEAHGQEHIAAKVRRARDKAFGVDYAMRNAVPSDPT